MFNSKSPICGVNGLNFEVRDIYRFVLFSLSGSQFGKGVNTICAMPVLFVIGGAGESARVEALLKKTQLSKAEVRGFLVNNYICVGNRIHAYVITPLRWKRVQCNMSGGQSIWKLRCGEQLLWGND